MKNISILILFGILLAFTKNARGQELGLGFRIGVTKAHFAGDFPKELNNTKWSQTNKTGYIFSGFINLSVDHLHTRIGLAFTEAGGNIIKEKKDDVIHTENFYNVIVNSFGGQFDILFGGRIRILPIGLNLSIPTGTKIHHTYKVYSHHLYNGDSLIEDPNLKLRVDLKYSIGLELKIYDGILIGVRHQVFSTERFKDNKNIFEKDKPTPLRPAFTEFSLRLYLNLFD